MKINAERSFEKKWEDTGQRREWVSARKRRGKHKLQASFYVF